MAETEGQVEAAGDGASLAATVPESAVPPARKPRKARKKRAGSGLFGRLLIVLIVALLAVGAVSLSGKPIPLPVWVVAEIEARLNRALADSLPEGAISLGAVDLTVDGRWMPLLELDDVRVLKPGGEALLTLPEVALSIDGRGLLSGEARVSSVHVIGAQLAVLRDAEGRVDISMGREAATPQVSSFADLFALLDKSLSAPGLRHLQTIEAEALAITLTDRRSGRNFQLGDGRLTLANATESLSLELSASLQGSGQQGRATVTVVSDKATATQANHARITARIEAVAAQDLAAQAALLAPLAVLDAPISGRIAASLDESGITGLEGELDIGAGALHPTEAAAPVAFDRAAISMRYDPAEGKVVLNRLEVASRTLRAKAKGQAYLQDASGARITGPLTGVLPEAFLTQFQFSEVMIDPEGVFAEPVRFSAGALDMRFRLNPFLAEIGQLSLAEDSRRLTANGRIGADAAGWAASVDLALNEIAHDRLIAIWPKTLLVRTRDWVGRNLLKARVFDVKAALRLQPGQEPRLHLGYSFADADVRFLATLPPIQNGFGYSTIDGVTYTMVLSKGTVTAPVGGEIDVSGSVFRVANVTQKPARADITLSTTSSLTAALSLLDLPPFRFMTKADRPVDLGEGEADISTRLSLPLQKKIALADVDYDVAGTVRNFSSDRLVPKRVIRAETLKVTATPKGLAISGAGRLGEVPFDATYAQGFGAAEKGRATIRGAVVLSQAVAEEFGLGLPKGMVSGKGSAEVAIDLIKGLPGTLRLTSSLQGIGLTIPEVAWSKPSASRGTLEAEVTLGAVPEVERLTLNAAGLKAEGRVSMKPGGGLEKAHFERVTLDDWLDATVDLLGRGSGKAVGIALTGGSVDMRKMPGASERRSGASGQGGGPLTLALDRLIVTASIALHDFRGKFSLIGGLNGDFAARLNGGPEVQGTVVPHKNGSAVRLRAKDAGATVAAAGVFQSARGGALDLTLTPRPREGHYDGNLYIRNVRVKNANVLAEFLNAISVVGILEQLNGSGLVFSDVEGQFLLTPKAVEVRHGSAVGASLGVSMAGVYQTGNGQLNMQGVISPVYMLNGIGAVMSKRGEGVFGFNYGLRGTADNPSVDVNPLSILTPGLFREIFRRKPAVLGEGEAPATDKEKD